ncbi:MAG: DNA mismatch endonuclease Vsr [Gemmatimonadota bacterium]|uniref:very short patch repair endonuclease n=1 Tax=Candidatus Palauibacter scopulicola TaxID=3056741 RepID=UPI00238319D7|nr:DNA mismatch endonuclease Vsr [Candidatus Palauibacter scopulicola]MDE2663479.1 DNA mismatch endonuclease Vsr [Candidatus Palauibacter scopulicola]
MTDIVDARTRSAMMSGIRGKDTKPEILVRRFLHRSGFRFRLHHKDLPGRPDIVLPRYRTVVEVRGCFWHRHEDCPFAYMPKSNRAFWKAKLEGNRARDLRNLQKLRELGWKTIEVWECELAGDEILESLPALIRADCDLPASRLPT